MYVLRHKEARSRNHCCFGEAVSITHSLRACVRACARGCVSVVCVGGLSGLVRVRMCVKSAYAVLYCLLWPPCFHHIF